MERELLSVLTRCHCWQLDLDLVARQIPIRRFTQASGFFIRLALERPFLWQIHDCKRLELEHARAERKLDEVGITLHGHVQRDPLLLLCVPWRWDFDLLPRLAAHDRWKQRYMLLSDAFVTRSQPSRASVQRHHELSVQQRVHGIKCSRNGLGALGIAQHYIVTLVRVRWLKLDGFGARLLFVRREPEGVNGRAATCGLHKLHTGPDAAVLAAAVVIGLWSFMDPRDPL